MFYIEFSIEQSGRVLKGLTLLELDFNFCTEFSMEILYRVPKGLSTQYSSTEATLAIYERSLGIIPFCPLPFSTRTPFATL